MNDKDERASAENGVKPKPQKKPKSVESKGAKPAKKKPKKVVERAEFKTSIEDYAQSANVSIGMINAVKRAIGTELSLTATEWKRIIRVFRRKPEGVDFKQMLQKEGVKINGLL